MSEEPFQCFGTNWLVARRLGKPLLFELSTVFKNFEIDIVKKKSSKRIKDFHLVAEVDFETDSTLKLGKKATTRGKANNRSWVTFDVL